MNGRRKKMAWSAPARPAFRVCAGIVAALMLAPFIILPLRGDYRIFESKRVVVTSMFMIAVFAFAALVGRVPAWMIGDDLETYAAKDHRLAQIIGAVVALVMLALIAWLALKRS